MTHGNLGTGKKSVVLLKEEPTWAGTIATATSVFLRPKEYDFQKVPSIVQSTHAAATELGFAKKVVESALGMQGFELDMTSIGWLLKWIMGSKDSAQQGATSEYKHTFKFGTAIKSVKSFVNEGGLATPYYRNYLGLVPNRLALNVQIYDWVNGEIGFLGKTNETGTNPGSASYATDNLRVAYDGFTVKFGAIITGATKANPCVISSTAHGLANGDSIVINDVEGMTELNGNTYTVASVSANTFALSGINSTAYTTYTEGGAAYKSFTDPFDMRFEVGYPDAKADNFVSDGTGQTTGIFVGQPSCMLDFQSQLTTNHQLAAFEAYTQRAIEVTLDSGTLIPSGNGSNYKMKITIPRALIKNYTRRSNGPGPIIPGIYVVPMFDPAANYSIKIEVWNNTTAYTDST